jgi:hypothetical protein
MGRACSTSGGEKKQTEENEKRRRKHIGYWWESQTRPLGRPICTWVDNIKIVSGEIRWNGMDLIDVAQERGHWRALVNTEIKLRAPQNAGN